jgi:hypothetical protein
VNTATPLGERKPKGGRPKKTTAPAEAPIAFPAQEASDPL